MKFMGTEPGGYLKGSLQIALLTKARFEPPSSLVKGLLVVTRQSVNYQKLHVSQYKGLPQPQF